MYFTEVQNKDVPLSVDFGTTNSTVLHFPKVVLELITFNSTSTHDLFTTSFINFSVGILLAMCSKTSL
jgi:hypothetical protein